MIDHSKLPPLPSPSSSRLIDRLLLLFSSFLRSARQNTSLLLAKTYTTTAQPHIRPPSTLCTSNFKAIIGHLRVQKLLFILLRIFFSCFSTRINTLFAMDGCKYLAPTPEKPDSFQPAPLTSHPPQHPPPFPPWRTCLGPVTLFSRTKATLSPKAPQDLSVSLSLSLSFAESLTPTPFSSPHRQRVSHSTGC